MINLQQKSEAELQELLDSTAKILKEKRDTRRNTAIAQITEIAEAAGLSVFIRGDKRNPNRSSEALVKAYQHPDKPDVIWNGHGSTPRWLKELVKAGREKSEFEIKAPNSQTTESAPQEQKQGE